MRSKQWLIAVALVAGMGCGVTGCTTSADSLVRARTSARTFALAVTVNGGSQPSAEQWSALRTTFTAMLAKRGFTLVENPAHAANIIHVNFVTPPGDPLTGTAMVLAIEPAPPPLAIGYPGTGISGPSRVTLASFDPVLAADHTIYLAPQNESEVSSPPLGPDSG